MPVVTLSAMAYGMRRGYVRAASLVFVLELFEHNGSLMDSVRENKRNPYSIPTQKCTIQD